MNETKRIDKRGLLPQQKEHEALLCALRQLEDALTPLTQGAKNGWRERTNSLLRSAATSIELHCQAAEGPDGLLTEAERDAGRSRNVRTARHEHEQLCERTQALVLLLSQDVEIDVLRERGAEILTILRHHLDLVGDLAYDAAFDLDAGVGD